MTGGRRGPTLLVLPISVCWHYVTTARSAETKKRAILSSSDSSVLQISFTEEVFCWRKYLFWIFPNTVSILLRKQIPIIWSKRFCSLTMQTKVVRQAPWYMALIERVTLTCTELLREEKSTSKNAPGLDNYWKMSWLAKTMFIGRVSTLLVV